VSWCRLAAVSLLLSVSTVGAAMAAPRVDSGQWRITWLLTSMQGRSGIPREYLEQQAVTESRCLDRVPTLPLPSGQDHQCQLELVSATAETITWRGHCPVAGDRARQVQGVLVYRGAALEGTLSIETGGVTARYEVRGRWLHPECRQ